MSYEIIQKLKYIFDGYSLGFILITSSYGLWVDTNQSRNKGTDRDARLAKRVYITSIVIILSLFIILRLI